MPTLVEPQQERLPELEESEHLGAEATAGDVPLKTRLLLPVLVPLLAVGIVAFLVLDISRLFLADDENVALGVAIGITLLILVGASVLAMLPPLKTSSLAVVLSCVFLLVSLGGLASLGSSLDDGEGGAGNGLVNPPGRVTSTVGVDAGPGLSFNGVRFTGDYTATAGIVQITYGGAPSHTLAIQDARYATFLLNSGSRPRSGTVRLTPGKYTIYCTVPGHEAAGMKATITVSAP